MPAVNEADYNDPNCQNEASGQQWGHARVDGTRRPVMKQIPASDQSNPHFHKNHYYIVHNGGIFFSRRVEVDQSDILVRFSRRTDPSNRVLTSDELMNSPWWLNDARFEDLFKRAEAAGVGLLEMARRQLAIPKDWNDGALVVVARPKILLAAYAGPGNSAEDDKDPRFLFKEAHGTWIDQLYIPGLGRKRWLANPPQINRAPTWLTFLRAKPLPEVEKTRKY